MSQRTRDLLCPATVGALLLATSLLPGCGGGSDAGSGAAPVMSVPPAEGVMPPAVEQAKEAGTPVDPALVAADNAFGLNLLNTLIPANSGQNLAISPLSVAMTLQIVYNGAVAVRPRRPWRHRCSSVA